MCRRILLHFHFLKNKFNLKMLEELLKLADLKVPVEFNKKVASARQKKQHCTLVSLTTNSVSLVMYQY